MVRNNNVKSIVLVLLCIVATSDSQVLSDVKHHSLILRGIHFTLEQKYDSAEITFRSIIKKYPEHPSGYAYLAGMYQARYTDYGDALNKELYDSLLNATSRLAEILIRNTAFSAWGYYYAGLSDAFRSFTVSENGNMPMGFYYGISASRSLNKCLEADSSFVIAKNILGSYYFWRSKLAWIPFISDRTQEGISMVEQSLTHPFEKHLASHNLMLILISEKRFEEAEKYGLVMLEAYPQNRSFLWNMMTVYEQWGMQSQLKSIVKRLLSSAQDAKVINYYTEATCRLKLARFALQENNLVDARSECESVILLEKYIDKTKGDLRKKITLAKELLTEIDKK